MKTKTKKKTKAKVIRPGPNAYAIYISIGGSHTIVGTFGTERAARNWALGSGFESADFDVLPLNEVNKS